MVDEQRDMWGETAEERAARINARDLARTVFEERQVRDGLGRLTGPERLAFDAGYHAGRADYLATPGYESHVSGREDER